MTDLWGQSMLDAMRAKNPTWVSDHEQMIKLQPRAAIEAWRIIHPEDFGSYSPYRSLRELGADEIVQDTTYPPERPSLTIPEVRRLIKMDREEIIDLLKVATQQGWNANRIATEIRNKGRPQGS